jgi:hypothetical protein
MVDVETLTEVDNSIISSKEEKDELKWVLRDLKILDSMIWNDKLDMETKSEPDVEELPKIEHLSFGNSSNFETAQVKLVVTEEIFHKWNFDVENEYLDDENIDDNNLNSDYKVNEGET